MSKTEYCPHAKEYKWKDNTFQECGLKEGSDCRYPFAPIMQLKCTRRLETEREKSTEQDIINYLIIKFQDKSEQAADLFCKNKQLEADLAALRKKLEDCKKMILFVDSCMKTVLERARDHSDYVKISLSELNDAREDIKHYLEAVL